MIEVSNLTKKYGANLALDNLSFFVKQGEILGFLGLNGAGKSTTMNIITGYLSATNGSCKVNGFDVLENPKEAKMSIGYLPEIPPLYLDMTVKEYLQFVYEIKKVKLPRNAHIQEICEIVKISHVFDRLIKNLSKGYKQRVGIAQALLGNPEVLILDEPTVGLDPKQIIEIRNLIRSLGERHTVILSSHILSEIQAVCDRVIVINQGKLVADDTASNLAKKMSSDHHFNILVEGDNDDITQKLKDVNGMELVQPLGLKEEGVYEYQVESNGEVDIRREIFKVLSKNDLPLLGMQSSELTLEQIFLQLTTSHDENENDADTDDKSDTPEESVTSVKNEEENEGSVE